MKGLAKIGLTLRSDCNAAGLVWPATKAADGEGERGNFRHSGDPARRDCLRLHKS
jgi:hypothetical protein